MDISNRNESNLIQTNWNTIRRNGPKGDRIRNFYLLPFWGLNCIDLDTQLIGQRHIYIYERAPIVGRPAAKVPLERYPPFFVAVEHVL